MSYVVFIDVDHTLLKINSGEGVLRKARREGQLPVLRMVHAIGLAILYKIKLANPYRIMTKFAEWVGGWHVDEFGEFCRILTDEIHIPALRPEMIKEIKEHKDRGAHLVILSSSIRPVCDPLAVHFGMDAVISSELDIKEGIYTGKPDGEFCFRENKLRRMEEYLENIHYSKEDAYYYGDSTDDLPVLYAIGHPVCVYPKWRLKKIALREGWRVIPA
ncbi:MAG: HAD-IB family hydrolase [Bacteroidales bacterium]|nr:HAD-IB family hydrolase [Bacteroidales bacterium]